MKLAHANAFGGFSVLESTVSRFDYAPHNHDEFVLAFYRGGQQRFMCAGHKGKATAGDILVISPGVLHSGKTLEGEGWSYTSLYLSVAQISEMTGLSSAQVYEKLPSYLYLAKRPDLVFDMDYSLEEPTEREFGLSHTVCVIFSSKHSQREVGKKIPSKFQEIYDFLAEEPHNAITLSDLATMASQSPEHFSRSFKVHYGVSPFQFLKASRIRLARSCIVQGVSLCEAAISSGFSDQSHMTRQFKKIYGVSPGHFQKYQ